MRRLSSNWRKACIVHRSFWLGKIFSQDAEMTVKLLVWSVQELASLKFSERLACFSTLFDAIQCIVQCYRYYHHVKRFRIGLLSSIWRSSEASNTAVRSSCGHFNLIYLCRCIYLHPNCIELTRCLCWSAWCCATIRVRHCYGDVRCCSLWFLTTISLAASSILRALKDEWR